MINKKLRKVITFSKVNIDMMEALALKTGWVTPSEIVRRALEELHGKYFKPYVVGGITPSTEGDAVRSAELRAKSKHIESKRLEELQNEKKALICTDLLKGEVVDGMCVFTQYTLKGDNRMTLPLSQVDPIIAETSLFMPSKEAVLNKRPDLQEKFK